MPDIKVRVGQQNAVKVVSSISGSSVAIVAENVIGGIASVSQLTVTGISSLSQLNVSGISTFVGLSTFKNDVYIGGDLYVADDINFDEFTAKNGNITKTLTVGEEIYYPPGGPYSVAYFDLNHLLVSTASTSVAINETNYMLTTNSFGVPTWSNSIDGGFY